MSSLQRVRPSYEERSDQQLRLTKMKQCAQLDARNQTMYRKACDNVCKAQKALAGLVAFQLVVEAPPPSLAVRKSSLGNQRVHDVMAATAALTTAGVQGFTENNVVQLAAQMQDEPPLQSTQYLRTAATAPSYFTGTIASEYK